MDPAIIGVSIPVVAIVCGVGAGVFKHWTQHEQEMARIRAMSGSNLSQGQTSSIEELRQEIMALRDTTTQYDMSVEHTLAEIQNRLAHLEGRQGEKMKQLDPKTSETPQPQLQQVGHGPAKRS
jgi:hypothetical protein